ncbi:MAG: hypothetical protein JXA77_01555 [Bacteroidales bacterium]|nr:hypothetical protein [Bacteroidales bacterium]MBN2820128.1 hypothetical protein [Bacteroidales bacterium]
MKVKGTAIKTTRDFVKTKYTKDYDKWLNSLPPESKKFFEGSLDVTEWFPLKEAYKIPILKISEMFFSGNNKECAEAIGYYSADVALKGFYKVFLLVASPNYLAQRASKIITTFYQPSAVETVSLSPNSTAIRVTEFAEMDNTLEYRFGGWCKRALELSNCKNVNFKIKSSLAKGDDCTEIVFTWE